MVMRRVAWDHLTVARSAEDLDSTASKQLDSNGVESHKLTRTDHFECLAAMKQAKSLRREHGVYSSQDAYRTASSR